MKVFKNLNYNSFSEYRTMIMGIAAILIAVCHIASYSSFPKNIFTSLIYDFNIGVEIFLIMSGIGLYYSLSSSKYSFKEYYKKRLLNVYFIFLLINFPDTVYQDLIVTKVSAFDFLLDWLGISYWIGPSMVGWYVQFAMVLYLIYPIIFKVLKQCEKKNTSLLCTVVACVLWIVLCIILEKYCCELYARIEASLTRFPTFLAGCYLGQAVYNKKRVSWKIYAISCIGIVVWLIIKAAGLRMIYQRLSHFLLGIAVCLLIVILVNLVSVKPIIKGFEFFGQISLELYLVHLALLRAATVSVEVLPIWKYTIVIIVSIPISYFISKIRNAVVKLYTKRLTEKSTQ